MTDKSAHWSYFIEFFAIPPATLALAGFAYLYLSLAYVIVLILSGMVLWTLMEYWIHRILLHHAPYLSEKHDSHHQQPKGYIGINSFGVLCAYLAIGLFLALIFSFPVSLALTAGISTMYFVYIIVHHNLHHGDRDEFGRVMTNLWEHHASHHRGGNKDFGVSTTLWDYVFFTKRLG